MKYKLVWLTVCAMWFSGCTSQQYEQAFWSKEKREAYRQAQEKQEAERQRFKEELAAHPPTFPKVTIGMPFATLEQQILILNPLIRTANSEETIRQVGIERISEFNDTKTIMYQLFDHDFSKTSLNISHVFITVRGGTVIGYFRP